jgi:hypothetical protein
MVGTPGDDLAARLQRSLADTFTIERELGGGGMARVFLAHERALARRVVVKVLDLEGAVAASAERFRREVQVIAKLQHPHIVPVLTAGGDDTLLWYVMPYVSGESLRARLTREGALPLPDALRIARELFDALGFAHDHGIVHRDVKPENILLEGKHAVVADFGVAKALADAGVSSGLTSAGIALGTPAYMAPEQAMADATTNHRADLYAAGAVLYEMLVGAPPFSGSAQSVIAAHITAEPPRIDQRRGDVPLMLAQLIRQLMAKNPAERPQNAHEALTILETVSTPAATATPLLRSTELGRKPRRATMWIAAAAVVIIAGAAWARFRAPSAGVAEGADVIAVMPLGSTGDSTLARLGRDIVVTLSTSLDGVGSIRSVDAMSVLQGVKDIPQPVRIDDARKLGARLGAKTVIHGVVTSEGGLARLDVALYPVSGGDAIAKASARSAPDNIRALTDTLTRQLLEQIWRHGTPPSAVLSDVATSSGEALRAFLVGESAFERNQMDTAIAAYTHAVAADSNFAQAWLRLDYTRGMVLLPVDTAVRSHLLALRERLPRRERDWLSIRNIGLPFLASLDSVRSVAARYPDSYAIQYLVMDLIVHSGPRYGIAISDALPLLERLRTLSPRSVDVAFHRQFVAMAMADTAAMVAAQRTKMEGESRDAHDYDEAVLRAFEAMTSGHASSLREVVKRGDKGMASLIKLNPEFGWYPNFSNVSLASPVASDSLTEALAGTSFGAEYPQFLAFGRASRSIARGNVHDGLIGAANFAGERAPVSVRNSTVWSAANAAWFGLIPVSEAEATIARAKPQLANLTGLGALEVAWSEAVVAIAAKDSARMEAAIKSITDTSRVGRAIPRGLRALYRERRTGAVDSLRSFEDDAMRTVGNFAVSLPIHRAALGRALIKSGDAAGAERLLQWPDAAPNNVRLALIGFHFGHYTSYERGQAAEARGDRKSAIRHYNDFLTMIDRPPPAMAASIADAKARLARLTSDLPRAR